MRVIKRANKPKITSFPLTCSKIKFWEKSSQEENSPVVTEDSENPADEKGKDGKGSIHYGDPGYEDMLNNPEDYEEEVEKTTWGEVCRSCCCHSAKEWGHIFIYLCGICFFLYFFIFSLELLGTGAKVLTGCAAAGLFGDNTNPVAALIIGMLVTVLLQSSSTTTSIIVSLVGSGAITVEPAIYMVMGERFFVANCSFMVSSENLIHHSLLAHFDSLKQVRTSEHPSRIQSSQWAKWATETNWKEPSLERQYTICSTFFLFSSCFLLR
jgi:hypothetical protein